MAENTGKTAIVTGASRGIGLAIAKKLAKSGYNIAVVDACDLEKSEDAVKEVKALGVDAKAYQCNVADFAAVEQTVKQINEDFGGIYILVNNAGITRDGLLIKMTEENFDAVINVNLKGTFNFIKHVSPIMMKKREGRVVSISSIVGIEGQAGQVNYSASKAGVIGITKSCAREFASRNITFNAIAPGYVETPMTAVLTDKQKEAIFEMIPLKRYGQPEDIANAVNFLCSEDASYITGQILSVDGGMHM
ncbi:MAG: 3-oxoacyl-[Clostridiales bacterium]|nr:3-oxoacyl-[acyl-carrier-protein] reductase [Clostridiales bacterium]